MTTFTQKIVVGVDGSPSGAAAVDWAAAEGRLRGLAIELVLAYEASWVGIAPESFVVPAPSAVPLPHILEEAKARVLAIWPAAEVTLLPLGESPAHALVSLSNEATLVVVGAHGRSAVGRLLLGSVSGHVAMHAHSPAVIVRGNPDRDDRLVAVGIDDSVTSGAALEWACLEAELRDTPLLVLHAWQPPPATGYGAWTPPMSLEADIRKAAEEFTAGVVGHLRESHPDVDIRAEVVEGRPAAALVDLSHRAQLLVVGAHGRGAFPSIWFGSAATAVIHESGCPVVVIPAIR